MDETKSLKTPQMNRWWTTLIAIAAVFALLTIVVNIVTYKDMSNDEQGGVLMAAGIALPVISMASILLTMVFQNLGYNPLVREMREGFKMLAERLEAQDAKFDKIIEVLDKGNKTDPDGKGKVDGGADA